MSGQASSLEAHYRQVSPQLLARVTQLWSARGLDLGTVWRATVRELPGFGPLEPARPPASSRPVDLLLLFDQAAGWLLCLRVAVGCAWRTAETQGRSTLSPDQLRSLMAILSRLREEIAAMRVLVVAGLATPAMQIVRSISEDVDMALVVLLRPKVARQFAECRSPEEAGDFWKRHIAGGRAFRTVAEQLYRVGLDYSDDSSYARWRKEIQVLLGAAVHTSYVGGGTGGRTAEDAEGSPLTPAAMECLHFATLRLQEMCVYSLMLGQALREDIVAGSASATAGEMPLVRVALDGGEIVLDQMRWLTAGDEAPATSSVS